MTAAVPEETAPGERVPVYAGPPPTLRPSPDLLPPAPPRPEVAEEVPEPAGPVPPYLLAMRTAGWAWWRPLAGLLVIAFLLAVGFVLTRIVDLLTGTGADLDPVPLTWPGLLVTGLLLAVALPAVLLAWPLVHGVGPGRGLSVAGRLRWPLLGRFSLLALATVGAAVVLGVAGAALLGDREITGPVPELPWVLVIGLMTVPLRAAGEELLLRGYLSQTVAGWVGRPVAGAVVAAVVSALLGAASHGIDDGTAFLGRVALALAASAVVVLTGGIEAAVALHAVCGVVVLLLAAGLGEDAVPGLTSGAAAPAFLLVTAVGLLGFTALVARRGART